LLLHLHGIGITIICCWLSVAQQTWV